MEDISLKLIESLKAIEPSESVEESLARVLKNQAEEKRRQFEAIINYFQNRYGMTAQEFYQSRIEDKSHSWEDEDTYFDWVTAADQIPGINAEIMKLREILTRANRK